MKKTEEVTFEVLVLIGSRWEAQGVYKTREQNVAIRDAKSLEKVSTIKAVKVVKEFYDEKAKTSRTLNVYESKIKGEPAKPAPLKVKVKPQGKSVPKRARTKGGKDKAGSAGGSPSDAMIAAPPSMEGGPKRPSLLSAFLQTILSLVAAAITALVVTQLATISMGNMKSIGFVGKNDFLILVFILVFAVTALALITRILTKLKRISPNLPSLSLSLPRTKPTAQARPLDSRPHAPAPIIADVQAGDIQAGDAQANEKAEEQAPEAEKAPVVEPQPDDLLTEVITMNAFTADVVDVIKGEEDKRDAHTVFGVVLFLVGAVQALRAQRKLTDDTYQRVIYKTLGSLGLSKERAQHFIEHTDEYLISNARYSQMFQAGRNAMSANLEGGIGPRGALVDVMDDWDKPKAPVDNRQPVTVLFTDIAGSTAMTQKLGDEAAQEVVRIHNTIVRDAIKSFAGKEIKHTGDGIMASFPSAVAGVEAARDMQRHTKTHNTTRPDLPLQLKIGLNAGDPIAEDDDLFGSTVQLAARIVDKAEAGRILVSGSVHGLSQGKSLRFERFGDLEMKGFDETITVYTALWDDSLPAAKPMAVPTPAPEPEPEPETPAPETPEPEPEVAPATAEPVPAAAPESPVPDAPASQVSGAETSQAKTDTPPVEPKAEAQKPEAQKPKAQKTEPKKTGPKKADAEMSETPSDTKPDGTASA